MSFLFDLEPPPAIQGVCVWGVLLSFLLRTPPPPPHPRFGFGTGDPGGRRGRSAGSLQCRCPQTFHWAWFVHCNRRTVYTIIKNILRNLIQNCHNLLWKAFVYLSCQTRLECVWYDYPELKVLFGIKVLQTKPLHIQIYTCWRFIYIFSKDDVILISCFLWHPRISQVVLTWTFLTFTIRRCTSA